MQMIHTKRPVRSRMSRLVALATAAAISSSLVIGAPAQTAFAGPYPSFTFNGAGWGHGIGLSQWGAKGFAEHGDTGEKIATYYFQGTKIGTITSVQVKVNIDEKKGSRSSWKIQSGYSGGTLSAYALSSGSRGALLKDLPYSGGPYTVSASNGLVKIADGRGSIVAQRSGGIVIAPKAGSVSPPLTCVVSASGPYKHTNVRYRGEIHFTASGSSVKAVNRLPMEDYLYGVVPRESPASWPAEALRAQAIVARGYAYVDRNKELACTTSSQVYNGHSRLSGSTVVKHEAGSTNGAVDSTKNKVVMTQKGTVVQTFFHSSSGGHTANIEDVWLSAAPQPYYKGVDDPYCSGPNDPWPQPVTYNGLDIAKKLAPKVSGAPSGAGTTVWVTSLVTHRASSDFVRTVDVRWSNGQLNTGVPGDTLRSVLGLKSTKFFVGPPRIAYADRYGTAVEVSKEAYPDGGAQAVVIANGSDACFPDALTAAALGGLAEGPVLLTLKDELPNVTLAEIKRLKPKIVYIVGGHQSVSLAVEEKLRGAASAEVKRLRGADRYETAAEVARCMIKLGAPTDTVLIASGERWADAAVAAASAAGSGYPLLLTQGEQLPVPSRDVLNEIGASRSIVFGGPVTIGDRPLSSVCAITGEKSPERRFGEKGDRYRLAVEAAEWCRSQLGYTLDKVYVCSGETFPDSVTGGVLAGKGRFPLVLTPSRSVSSATEAFLKDHRADIGTLVVIGGPVSISEEVASTLGGCIGAQ